MKLYLHLGLFVALCAVVVDIQSMEPDDSCSVSDSESWDEEQGKDFPLLHECVQSDNPELIKKHFAHLRDKDRLESSDTALWLGIHSNKPHVVKSALENKAAINKIGSDQSTPLMTAIKLFTREMKQPANLLVILSGPSFESIPSFNDLTVIKLLLAHGADPNRGAPDISPLTILADSQTFNLARKNAIRTLMISGGDHEKFDEPTPLAMWAFAPVDHANDELKGFMNECARVFDQLLKNVKSGKEIAFINVGDYSRRHVKDIHGNNLLYYALLGNNKAVADKLLKIWPQLLIQPNFEGKSIMNCDQVSQNFVKMYLYDYCATLPDRTAELRAANKESI